MVSKKVSSIGNNQDYNMSKEILMIDRLSEMCPNEFTANYIFDVLKMDKNFIISNNRGAGKSTLRLLNIILGILTHNINTVIIDSNEIFGNNESTVLLFDNNMNNSEKQLKELGRMLSKFGIEPRYLTKNKLIIR